MTTINRNDMCPCGSGKKYKKCCQNNKVTQLSDIISAELVEEQHSILSYTIFHYENEIEEELEDLPIEEMPEEMETVFNHYATLWQIFCNPTDGYYSVMEEYIETEAVRIKRPRVRQVVESWRDGFPSLVRVEKKHSDTNYVVREILTEKEFPLTLLTGRPFSEQEVLFGFFVPYESAFTVFTEVLNFEGEESKKAEAGIRSLYKEVLADDPELFYEDYVLETVEALIYGSLDDMLDELEWGHELHQEIADALKQSLEEEEAPTTLIRLGVTLWYQFCRKQFPTHIQKPNIYVAALHYLVDSLLYDETLLVKKEYAEMYDVSVSSLTFKVKELENALEEELTELRESVFFDEAWDDDDETFFDEEDFKNNFDFDFFDEGDIEYDPKEIANQQAQDIIYEAFEEKNAAKRKKLAKEALTINPNCADAYVILGGEERDINKRLSLYKKGLEAGEQYLGKKLMKEAKGHFWGMHETRPYMRVKMELAMLLFEIDKVDEAIHHFEEMLELNPFDNQGVRYELTKAYFKKGSYNKVSELFKEYAIDDAHTAYGKLFIHYKNHGIGETLEKLLESAKQTNPHVIAYLIKQKKLLTSQPDHISFGDESEAVSFVLDFGEFWWEEKELMEWLH